MSSIIKTISQNAKDAFKDHQITELSRDGVFRSWRCGRPNSGVYAFYITTTPGCLIVTGDIGDLIVERMYDMLPWCRGSVDSIDYFAGKVPSSIPTRSFSDEKLEEWVREQIADPDTEHEHRELLEDSLDQLHYDGPDYWYREFNDIYGDPPNWTEFNSNFLWCREAVKWFVNNHDEPEVTPK